jgi:hypothetical protein
MDGAETHGMDRHDEASGPDYEQLRRHLQGPRVEHPVGRQVPAVPPTAEAGNVNEAPTLHRLSVMEWLASVGHAVTRKLRRVPGSPMARLHPKR